MLPHRHARVSALFRIADISLARAGRETTSDAVSGREGLWQRVCGAWPAFATLGDMRSARLLLT